MKKANILLFSITAFFIFNFLINTTSVYAEVSTNICYGGYLYNFYSDKVNSSSVNYDSLVNGLKSQETNLNNARNGTPFPYQNFSVSYAGGKGYSDVLPRCYTVISNSVKNDYEESDPNYYSSSTKKYQTKACGNKYEKVAFDFLTVNSDGKTTNFVNGNTGRITLKIKLTGDKINRVIQENRLRAYPVYNGVANNSKAKGNCTVNKDNTVTCDNILPYEPSHNDSNEPNSSIYRVYFVINGIKDYDFEETEGNKQDYINSCGGANGKIYLGYVSTSIKNASDIIIDNPAKKKNTNAYTSCQKLNDISNASEALKKAYVNECYKEKISYSEGVNLEKTINTKVNFLNNIYEGMRGNVDFLSDYANKNRLVCTNNKFGVPFKDSDGNINSYGQIFESKVVYEEIKTYWGMVCIEDYYVDGGSPSLVQPGMGVNYFNKVGIKKTCTIFKVKNVVKPEECKTYIGGELHVTHDNVTPPGRGAAGPTEEFDNCIKKCDGGKYTQECINSCYQKVYSNERSELLSNTTKQNFDFTKQIETVKVAQEDVDVGYNLTEINFDAPSQKIISNGQEFLITRRNIIKNETGMTYDPTKVLTDTSSYVFTLSHAGRELYKMDAWLHCGERGGKIYFLNTSYSGPPGCSTDPDSEYNTALATSDKQRIELMELAEEKSQIEEYNINLVDSKTGYIYKVTGTTNKKKQIDGPQLEITDISEPNSISRSQKTEVVGVTDQGNTTRTYNDSISMKTIYKIELPKSYIKKDDAYVIAVDSSREDKKYYGYTGATNINGITYYKFEDFASSYRNKGITYKPELYTNGQNVYYTNLDSPNYNVLINSGAKVEELKNKNIPYATVTINDKSIIYELASKDKDIIDNIFVTLKVGGVTEGFVPFNETGFECYYGVYLSSNVRDVVDVEYERKGIEIIKSTDSDDKNKTGGKLNGLLNGLRYYYREIKLTDVFPNGRKPRWNWSGTINPDGTTTGAASNYNGYIVDPEKLTKDIESKGESVYTNSNEVDYEFTMTPALINKIREYNKSRVNGKKITYMDFSLAGRSSDKKNFSEKISEWYSGTSLPSNALNITDCNNAKNGGSGTTCENYGITGGGKK